MARQEDAGKGREMSKLHSESAKIAPATPSSPQEPVYGAACLMLADFKHFCVGHCVR